MLHRNDESGLMLISQPAHAWISGQLATQWGNMALGLTPPDLELKLAAEQHDIAWLDWEIHPTLNADTGLPYAFNELPTSDHLNIWKRATERALSYGRLPALLISMHGTYLYRRFHDFERDSSEDAKLARAFLEREEMLQSQLSESIRSTNDISPAQIEQHRQQLSLWDAISLTLCMGFDEPRTFEGVTSEGNAIGLRFEPSKEPEQAIVVEPWPFRVGTVELHCEGKHLAGTFNNRQSMLDALAAAPPKSLTINLAPVGSL